MNTAPDHSPLEELIDLLRQFVDGEDRSIAAAQRLESRIALGFASEHPLQELADYLAQYRPGGGEGLFGEAEATSEVRRWLARLEGQGSKGVAHDI